jgi:hypothetical protein
VNGAAAGDNGQRTSVDKITFPGGRGIVVLVAGVCRRRKIQRPIGHYIVDGLRNGAAVGISRAGRPVLKR